MARRGRAVNRVGVPSPGTPVVAWLLLAVLLVSALWVWSAHPYEFDDAFISYRYAANLAAGQGLVFNLGERVEGYSNFLWVLLLAGLDRLGAPPHATGPWLGVTALLATLTLAWSVIWRPGAGLPPDKKRGVLATAMLASLVIAHGFATTAGSGLETHFFALLVLIGGVALSHADLNRVSSLLVLGSVPALLLLARPDGILPGAALLFVVAWRAARERRDWRLGLLSAVIASIPAGLTGMMLIVLKIRYFGELVPNPYYAKGADALHIDAGIAYLIGFLRSYPVVIVGLAVAAIALRLPAASESARRMSAYTLAVAALYAAFLAKVGGDFMEYRLALQLLPIVVLTTAVAAIELLPNRWALTAVAAGVLTLGFLPVAIESRYYMQDLTEMNRYARQGERVGRSLAGLPAETKIATTLIGTIGYFSDLHIIDQWGLIDPHVRRRPPRPRFFRGHVRYTNLSEARSLGADLFLNHPHLCACDPSCVRGPYDVLVSIGRGECLRAQVLDPGSNLTDVFCADPARFPFAGPGICPQSAGHTDVEEHRHVAVSGD